MPTRQYLKSYEIKEKIYESRNSQIFRAIHKETNEPVIIKWVVSDRSKCLQSEFKIARLFQSEHIIKAYSLEQTNEGTALVLEDFGAISLKDCINKKPLDLNSFIKIAVQMCDSIAEVHGKDVIHKDINPGNFAINPLNGKLKITDFGIASLLSRTEQELISPDSLEGTLAYISPEQTGRMNRSIDYRTDFYSLGVTFYEMLTGKRPFEAEDAMGYVYSHIAEKPVAPDKVRSDIPKVLSELVLKLLNKNAEDRYKSVQGLKYDLEFLLTNGFDSDFKIGKKDFYTRLSIPQKLYGREKEIQTLLDVFDRITEENTVGDVRERSLLLVTGYSGVGKSVLVHEIYKPITESRGYFVSGKFDQFKRNIPYSAIIRAYSELIEQLLSEKKEKLEIWKKKLLGTLGNNAQVIIDVIPELELVIGTQPPVPELGPTETHNRFNLTFQKFIAVFTGKEHPLILFLDDMQWADSASLHLLKTLMVDSNYFLIICAYRDNEVDAGHPFILTIEELKKEGIDVDTLSLSPLNKEDVRNLIAESLDTDKESIDPLVNLVMKKTGGNPFFTGEFLKTLYLEKLLTFDLKQNKWSWVTEEIHQQNITDNVVDLMLGRIEKLPEKTRQILQLGACIGNMFDLYTLSLVAENPVSETLNNLYPAMSEGMLIPLGETKKLFIDETEFSKEEASLNMFKFQHDRVQQAAYSLIKEKERKALSLKIGRILLDNTGQEELDDKIFTILEHINYAIEIVNDEDEKLKYTKFYLRAGKKAKQSTAYQTAGEYLQNGICLLNQKSWESHYNLTLALYEQAAEVFYLIGDYTRMEEAMDLIFKKAKNSFDKTKTYQVKIQAYTSKQQFLKAIQTGLTILRALGVNLSENPDEKEISNANEELQKTLNGREIESLYELPEMQEPKKLEALKFLHLISIPAFYNNPALMILSIYKQVEFSIKYGNAAQSCVSYAEYGMVLCGLGGGHGQLDTGYQFGKLSLKMLDKFPNFTYRYRVVYANNEVILHWKEHLETTLKPLLSVYKDSMEVGDLLFAAHGISFYLAHSFFDGKELNLLKQEFDKYIIIVKKINQDIILVYMMIYRQVISNLIGESKSTFELLSESYNEFQKIKEYEESNDRVLIFVFYLNKTMLCYLFGELKLALDNAEKGWKYIASIIGFFYHPSFLFFDSLNRLAMYDTENKPNQKKLLEKVKSNQQILKNLANHAPMNHYHKWLLVEAELERIQGNRLQAMDFYEKSIQLAKENRYIQEEAIANEVFAKYWLKQDKFLYAKLHFTEAHKLYKNWGAIAKCNQIEEKYPEFIYKENKTEQNDTLLKTTKTISETLDLSSIVKASQAISGEIRLEALIRKFIKIIIENAGAEKCILLSRDKEELFIIGEGNTKKIESRPEKPIYFTEIGQDTLLCSRIVEFVFRTGKTIILHNASEEGQFTQASYIQKNKSKSIFCMPILQKNKQIGIIYLENNIATGAFTEKRVEILKILSSQATISFENAQFYENLERKVKERTRELQKSKEEIENINEISKLINSTTDINEVLATLFSTLQNDYSIDRCWLLLINDEDVYTYTTYNMDDIGDDELKFFYSFQHKISPELGILYYTYKRKRNFYRKDAKTLIAKEKELDRKIIESGGFSSFLLVPLIVLDEVIGFLYLTHSKNKLNLNRKKIKKINYFCQQISGAIHSSHLFMETEKAKREIEDEKEKSENLLLNILPKTIAEELKAKGGVKPQYYKSATVLFTDFKGFTKVAENLSVHELIKELDGCFFQFDEIAQRYGLEKIKTIGDSYMCAGGIPQTNHTHTIDCCLMALEIKAFMDKLKEIKSVLGKPYWEIRIGIHTGPLIAGVVGKKKFAYDIWGDTVNTASRMESAGVPGVINISGATFEKVKDYFDCEYRGKVKAKNKGEIDMYFLHCLQKKYSKDDEGRRNPNELFQDRYYRIKKGSRT